ncbi:MAG TPA: VOC family protein [Thermomicrobiales bacterium]|nr:VOC family protein [Thermomicrobiales bacterium]
MQMSYPPFGITTGRIFETHVQTTDLPRAMSFYGGVLGLEEAYYLAERQVAFYWIGAPGNAMLGVWGVSEERWRTSHFAFEITEDAIGPAIEQLRAAGIQVNDFFSNERDDPSVHAWMPAVGIFFRDPDGNSLEFVAMLPGPGRPDLGVVPLSEWRTISS